MRDEYEERQEKIRLMIDHMFDNEKGHTCEMCGESGWGNEMIHLESEDMWFHDDCAILCNVAACDECGEVIDFEKYKDCPICKEE